MADIFLSYASEDRARIEPLAKALIQAGFTLWWDRDILPGKDFSETIEREITAARAVVLAWSTASVRSQWVRDEAAFAREAGKLIPLIIDKADPPMGFRQIQAIDFGAWRGDSRSPAFNALVAALRELLGQEPGRAADNARISTSRGGRSFTWRRGVSAAAFILAAGALGLWALTKSSFAPGTPAIALGEVEVQGFVANPPDPERAAQAASYAAAFRQRLSELGIRNAPAADGRKTGASELILVGELNDVRGKNVLIARIDDRQTGTTLWTARREPTEGAAWESNLAAFALKCALKRRDPTLGTDVFSRYLYGCAHFLARDFTAFHAVAKELYDKAPTNANVMAYYSVAQAAIGWAQSKSAAERDRFIGEGTQLAQAALKLDPHNADALFTMGFALSDSQFAAQEQWWRRALAADPDLGWALGRYATLLTDVGRIREAADVGLRAQLHRRVVDSPVARTLAALGEWQEARAQYDLVRPMDPQFVGEDELLTDVLYGSIDAAEKKLREHPELAGESLGCSLQILAARRKQSVDAGRIVKECGEGDLSVRALTLSGNLDAAYREMETYVGPHEQPMPQMFWPEMRGFLRDARFWPLAMRLGLVDYWLDTDQWPDFCAARDLPFDCKEEARKVRGR